MTDNHRFNQAIARFDALNATDPNQETWQGAAYPKELLYAQRMSRQLEAFAPDASESLQLATRAQHLGRWQIPRSEYPMDRKGYLQWRNELKELHAKLAAEILIEVGYTQDVIDRVKFLLRKEKLKQDPETQTLEDVICLVFLQYYLEEFAGRKEEDKMVSILRKTWRKMSDRARKEAMQLDLPASIATLIHKAVPV